jgi:hypothetical protein
MTKSANKELIKESKSVDRKIYEEGKQQKPGNNEEPKIIRRTVPSNCCGWICALDLLEKGDWLEGIYVKEGKISSLVNVLGGNR